MCTEVLHIYSCGHEVQEKARCATSRWTNCGVLNRRIVKHDEKFLKPITNKVSPMQAQLDEDAPVAKRQDRESAMSIASGLEIKRRARTGCLPCRERRISCGEERPVCANCVKRKRQCVDFNQRVAFKPPIGDWPDHPGDVSTLQYHNSMLPGTQYSSHQPVGETQSSGHALDPMQSHPLVQEYCDAPYSFVSAWPPLGNPRLFESPSFLPAPSDVELLKMMKEGNFESAKGLSKDVSSHSARAPKSAQAGTRTSNATRDGDHIKTHKLHDSISTRQPTTAAGFNVGLTDTGTVGAERLVLGYSVENEPKDQLLTADNLLVTLKGKNINRLPIKVSEREIKRKEMSSSFPGHGLRGKCESDVSSSPLASAGSTEDESDSSALTIEKRRVVDRVMAYFYSIFRGLPTSRRAHLNIDRVTSPLLGITTSPDYSPTDGKSSFSLPPLTQVAGSKQDTSTPLQETTTANRKSAAGQSITSSRDGSHKHARGDDGNRSGEEDDESSSKRSRKDKMPCDIESNKRKFACPYYKRNPDKYLTRRSCVGPGWDEVRRVKEHLYRNHALPIFCPRCYETFKVESFLHDHQRAVEPCTRRPREIVEGFDKLQEKQLRSRKKPQTEPSEADKWKEMYRILFPADDEDMMPSPYLDEAWQRVYQKAKSPGFNELARYEEFLRRELPSAVRRELELAVEREFSPVEERLKSQLVEIVRDLQLQLFQTYTRSRNTEPTTASDAAQAMSAELTSDGSNAPGSSDPETHPKAAMRAEPTETDATTDKPTLENELASFEPAPPLEEYSTYDFDAVLFQFHELEGYGGFEDSAYGSMFDPNSSKGFADDSAYYYDPEFDNGEGPSGTH